MEDLTTWTLVDTGNRGTRTSNSWSLNNTTTSEADCYITKTLNTAADFTIEFKVVYGQGRYGANNNHLHFPWHVDSLRSDVWCTFETGEYPSPHRGIYDWRYFQEAGPSIVGQTNWIRLRRIGNMFYFTAFADAGMTAVFANESYSCAGTNPAVPRLLTDVKLGNVKQSATVVAMTISDVVLS